MIEFYYISGIIFWVIISIATIIGLCWVIKFVIDATIEIKDWYLKKFNKLFYISIFKYIFKKGFEK